jgi:fatty acid desaturase
MYFLLLYEAGQARSVLLIIGYGILFAVTMVPVYSLMHEAAHTTLHPNNWLNNFAGRWLCMLFIIPFTFYRHCHLRHHKKNRTDLEVWELYFEEREKRNKYGNLYLMMLGCGYLTCWLSVVLFAISPPLLYSSFFKQHKIIAGFLEGSNQKEKITTMRWESWLTILLQAAFISILHIPMLTWLTMYLIHGLFWSSQNYVNHAFSPRDIINGAHNLKMPVWLKPVYLNFNIHLAHHQNPKIPWIHLPNFIKKGESRIAFFRNYLRLWKGPVPSDEKEPDWSEGKHAEQEAGGFDKLSLTEQAEPNRTSSA